MQTETHHYDTSMPDISASGISRRGFFRGAAVGAMGVGAIASSVGFVGGAFADESVATQEATATASSRGFGGDVTATVTVNVSDGTLASVEIAGPDETPERGGRAIETMQQSMIDQGTVDIDAVSGATITSNAVLDAAGVAFGEATGAAPVSVCMKPGTYVGKAKGFWEETELPVAVKVNETSILKIDLPKTPSDRLLHMETEVILDSVRDDLVPRIIENQTLAIDTTTGATATSAAVIAGVRDALGQALEAGGSSKGALRRFQEAIQAPEVGEPIVKDVDVLVVGLGSGGICAMKSACEAIQSLNPPANSFGRVSILGIDRNARFGGRSSLAHEGCCINPPKYMEIANGGKPFVDEQVFRDYLTEHLTTDGKLYAKREMLDLYFRESGLTLDWLYDNGWRFGTPEMMKEGTGGYQTFNVALTSYVDEGSFADRQIIQRDYFREMLDEVVSQGGEYLLNTEGYELITEGDRVVGAKARNLKTRQEYVINAKAVIFGTGGFLDCPELVDRFLPEEQHGIRKNINVGQDTGEMIKAALAIGAGTCNEATPPAAPAASTDHWINNFEFTYGDTVSWNGRPDETGKNDIPTYCGNDFRMLALNKKGERFYNEGFAPDDMITFMDFYKSGNYYWALVSEDVLQAIATEGFTYYGGTYRDRGIMAEFDIDDLHEALGYAVDEGMAFTADTIEELAGLVGLDPQVMEASVRHYNDMCKAGVDEDFGKDAQMMVGLETGPFYAIQMYAWSYCSVAALDVDEQIRVLKDDHVTPIEGLYNVGVESLGVIQNPNAPYLGFGFAMGWAWTSGRLAGSNAAQYIKDTYGFAEISPWVGPDDDDLAALRAGAASA